ncbi:MAG: penicillin-binding transpeptidase domain-containing protein [Candidatus Zixiibacteriota bacterium]
MKAHYSKVRVGLVVITFAVLFVLFVTRLFFVQVVHGAQYREKAERQYLQMIEVPAARGEIFDTRGRKVVLNDSFKSMFAYPLTDEDVNKAYVELARIFRVSERAMRREYKLSPKKFRWIKRGLTIEEALRFDAGPSGIGLFIQEEPTRNYPYGDIGRAVLGFVDLDNTGKSGIELVMNEYLTGNNGRSVIQRDGLGREYHIQEIPIKEAEAGQAVVLTIDWDKQQIVEEELAKAVKKYHAKSGMAIFLDPHSGAILAAADYFPDQVDNDKPVKLNAVASAFEPGSIFKLITAAAALESGKVLPSDSYDAEQGRWRLGRHTLRDDHKHDTLSFRSAFELSSNIVMGKIANDVGGDDVLAMARKMGFGRKTRCGLNGESNGILERPPRWSQFVTSTFAIGHGVSVTTLQMAQAFATIASGGKLYQPFIVKGCINDDGQIVNEHECHPIEILDEKIVKELDSFMRGVVSRGTGEPLADAPFAIAGKTGTAEKPNLETGGYIKNKFMASFAGYFPADSPLVAGIVVLDEPEPIHYGGYTSGPAFKNIAIKFAALDKYNTATAQPQPNQKPASAEAKEPLVDATLDTISVRIPDVIGDSKDDAKEKLEKLGLDVRFSGTGRKVVSTNPCPETAVESGATVCCFLTPLTDEKRIMPDVTGLTIRETIALLDAYGIEASYSGTGRAIKQSPDAGSTLTEKDEVKITFKRSKGA